MKFKLFLTIAVILLAVGLLVQVRLHWALMVNLAIAKDEIVQLKADHQAFKSQIQELQQKTKNAVSDQK